MELLVPLLALALLGLAADRWAADSRDVGSDPRNRALTALFGRGRARGGRPPR
jgi:hypothetical protein